MNKYPSYSEYNFIDEDLTNNLVSVVDSIQDIGYKVPIIAKFTEILRNLTNITRHAVDYEVNSLIPSKVKDWLHKDIIEADDFLLTEKTIPLGPADWRVSLRKLKQFSKEIIIANKSDRVAVLHVNQLLESYIQTNNLAYKVLTPRAWKWGNGGLKSRQKIEVKAIIDLFLEAYICTIDQKQNFAIDVRARLIEGAEYILTNHLYQVVSDFNWMVKTIYPSKLLRQLLMGTPKCAGKLLGWYYQENNKEVLRFAHGGERVFFIDYTWPLTEFPYCDYYIAHSELEKTVIEDRMSNKIYKYFDISVPVLQTFGTDKHCKIFADTVQNSLKKQADITEELIYVSSTYFGDDFTGMTNFRCPDNLYVTWQHYLLNQLAKADFTVKIKTHPKSVIPQEKILSKFSKQIIQGNFDASFSNCRALLFDFAGSAFFDALFLDVPIILFNFNHRKLDAKTIDLLKQRVEIIDCTIDDKNCIVFDILKLERALSSNDYNLKVVEGLY